MGWTFSTHGTCEKCRSWVGEDWFFRAFPSVVRQMPGYTSQRRGTVRTLLN